MRRAAGAVFMLVNEGAEAREGDVVSRRDAGAGRKASDPKGRDNVFRTLVKTDAVAVGDQTFQVRYFELRTLRGQRRYSAEILLGPGDRIILDDDSVTNLAARTTRLVPATLYSRMLARAVAAA